MQIINASSAPLMKVQDLEHHIKCYGLGADVSALVPFCPAHCYFTYCLHLHYYL